MFLYMTLFILLVMSHIVFFYILLSWYYIKFLVRSIDALHCFQIAFYL